MIRDLIAYAAVLFLVAAAYPLAEALLRRSPSRDSRTLTAALAAGLAAGVLTLIMFWMSSLGIRYHVVTIMIAYVAVVLGAAWALRVRDKAHALHSAKQPEPPTLSLLYLLCIVIVAVAILFNALYWPFTRDDVVALYHPFAQQMVRDGALIPLIGVESLHRMYPMNIPLTFTFAYLAAGWDNEYLARLLPALLSIACLPATFVLGRKLAREWAGWLAPLLLAITPMFGGWASTGYTELPMALYLTLGVVFALRVWESGAWADGVLLGTCIGLAAWTKNTALIAIPSLIVWLGWALVHKRASWRTALLGIAACAALCAPWYLRNLIEVGDLLPDTAWVGQARRTLESLLIFITLPNNFGVSGWAMLIGLAWAIWQSRKPVTAYAWFAILVWIVPFIAAWWLFASYDPRFLASILPLVCALGAAACLRGWSLLPQEARRYAAPTLALVALGLTLYNAYFIVEYKDEILRSPLMTHETKMDIIEDRRTNR